MNGTPLACLFLLAACGLPGLESPQYRLTPEFTLYQLTGNARMQSESGGVRTDNDPVSARQLGQDQRDAGDVGGTISVGDGFSGLDFSYLHVDVDGGTARGTLEQNFGSLQAGDRVYSRLSGDEFKVSYFGKAYEHEWKSGAKVRLAPGFTLAHRDLSLRTTERNKARSQRIDLHDQVTPYLAVRARANWKLWAVNLDYAIDPGVHLGGSYEDILQDVALSLRYTALPDQDVDLIVGWRRFDLNASDSNDDLRWETKWKLDGFFFAVSIGF